MPFDTEFFYRASLYAVREPNASRNHLTTQQKAWVHRLLHLTDGSIVDTALISGVSPTGVARENRKLMANGAYVRKKPSKWNGVPRKTKTLSATRKRNQREDTLCKAILKDRNADVATLVAEHGLEPEYTRMLEELLKEKPSYTRAGEASGFGEKRINSWRERLEMLSRAERRAIIIYELCQEDPDLGAIAKKLRVDVHTVSLVVAQTGTHKQYNPTPVEDRIRAAIAEHPEFSNQEIADHLGAGFTRSYVWKIRRKIKDGTNGLPADMLHEQFFLDTAVEIARRHLDIEGGDKLEEIKRCARRQGMMPAFATQMPWPTSTESAKGYAIPKYRLLDAVLTHYLKAAGIKGPDHLAALTEKGFVQLQVPKAIFQALHFAIAACDVAFDRLKIQNGFYQSWLPSAPQMVTTAKQVLKLKN